MARKKKTRKKSPRKKVASSPKIRARKPKRLHLEYSGEDVVGWLAEYKTRNVDGDAETFKGFITKKTSPGGLRGVRPPMQGDPPCLSMDWLNSGGYEALKNRVAPLRKALRESDPAAYEKYKEYYTFPRGKQSVVDRVVALNRNIEAIIRKSTKD